MKGRVRLVGNESNELTFNHQCRIGNSDDSDLVVEPEDRSDVSIRLYWEKSHSSWMLHYERGGVAIGLNEEGVSGGQEPRPIFSPASIQIYGHHFVFDAIPESPILDGRQSGEAGKISLRGLKRVEVGRGKKEIKKEGVRLELDPDILGISSLHVILEKRDGLWHIENCGSNDTILNGQAFDRSKLVFGDRFKIGPYLFAFYVDHLMRLDDKNLGSVQARGLYRIVSKVDEETGKKSDLAILANVDLNLDGGEFVAIIGGSGQGKSTLLDALCGVYPPTKGKVWINEMEIAGRSAIMGAGVGYVPQDDIVHRELRVLDAILISAKLKLNLPNREIRSLTERILGNLDLSDHGTKQIRRLSGGQRKRVSIATEMLSSPSVLFLDEPTSGLDPATELDLMTALKRLAEAETTVVCTTHMLENAHICNRFVIVQEGRIIFDGPPGSAREYFLNHGDDSVRSTPSSSSKGGKLASYSRIFTEIKDAKRDGKDWENQFRNSRYKKKFRPPVANRRSRAGAKKESVRRVGFWRAFSLLNLRQWKILAADRLNLLFLFAQAFLIGTLIAWVADGVVLRGFLAVVAAMWFGCSNGAQQIVGELSIFRRERISGLGLNAYVCSKFGFLGLLTTVQAAVLFSTIYLVSFAVHSFEEGNPFGFPEMENGKEAKFEELLLSRMFPIPEKGRDLAEKISIQLLMPVMDENSEREQAPEAASAKVGVLAGPGLIESEELPGLILAVESAEDWRAGKRITFPHGETLILPEGLPAYPEEGFEAKDVAPGMARSPFLEQGGWTSFSKAQRESRWKPGAVVTCSITQQEFVLPSSLPSWQTETLRYRAIYGFVRFFGLEDAILDSNTVMESENRNTEFQFSQGASGELKLGNLITSVIGLKILALILAGTVGVSIGLMISALVQNSTQAVLWVPLILIPQILFGGFVVKVPEMSPSVRLVSFAFPSYAAQRIMDVSHVYGRIVPKISNKTEMPVFTEGDGEKVEWTEKDVASGEIKEKSQRFQRETRENPSWQNLLVIPERKGQHEVLGDFLPVFDADGSFKTSIRQEPDTVDQRRDIHSLYFQGIRFVRLRDAQLAIIVLICWVAFCYAVIMSALYSKQTGG